MLNDDEVATLYKIIKNKITCKTVLKRCQILLELDEIRGTGLAHSQIAHTYTVCPATITNTIQFYIRNGITDILNITSVQIQMQYCARRMGGHKKKFTDFSVSVFSCSYLSSSKFFHIHISIRNRKIYNHYPVKIYPHFYWHIFSI